MLAVRLAAPALIPAGINHAPNAGRAIDPREDPDPAELARLGVSAQRRVAVGPPPASLSLFVLEPRPSRARPPTVLLLHGIRDQKTSLLSWGRRLAGLGYRAVLVDLRGHGRSSGRFLSYGVQERRDLAQLLDALGERGPLGVLGHSYGAATALQLAAADRRVTVVVAVATFTRLRVVARLYVRRYLSFLARLVPEREIDRRVDEAGRQAGFDPDAASPLAAAPALRAALLVVHGADDASIPAQHSRAIYAAAAPPKRLVIVEGEGHNSVMADRRGVLRDEATRWLLRFLPAGVHSGNLDAGRGR